MTGTFPRLPYRRSHPLRQGALAHKGRRYESCRKNHRATARLGRATGRSLFDHLGCAQHYRWGYAKTERLGGLEVQDHLKFCRELHREIARLFAAQDAIDISRGPTPRIYQLRFRGKAPEFTAVKRALNEG